MGILHLNTIMRNKCSDNSIKKVSFKSLFGKTIAIDASIYMYRFMGDETLLESIYNMLALLRYYNIFPIFVFDGKSPIEKLSLLKERNKDKIQAENEYNKLKKLLESNKDYSIETINEISENMQYFKRRCVRLKISDIQQIKDLILAFGATYIQADGEADEICAKLVIKKKAYACMSEDMDLFLYGCPRVLRYLSLLNETIVLYDLNKILDDMKLSLIEFKQICILSGTDYNINRDIKNNLYETFKYFEKYKASNSLTNDFYDWLIDNTNYITNIYELYNIYHLFRLNNIILKKYKFCNKYLDVNNKNIQKIMKTDGFIFL